LAKGICSSKLPFESELRLMEITLFMLTFLVLFHSTQVLVAAVKATEPAELVEVLAGTASEGPDSKSNGNTLPQIKRPFGFNDWAPHTNANRGSWWFNSHDTSFEGMRCSHQPSPWIGDYGSFLIKPHVQEREQVLTYSPQRAMFRPYSFSTTLLPSNSKPDFLRKAQNISFEFAPASHAAIGRVTFPASTKSGQITVKVQNEGKGMVSKHHNEIHGRATDTSGAAPPTWQGLFFVMRAEPEASSIVCRDASCTFQFLNPKHAVTFYVGTSFISNKQAKNNLESEIGSKSVDDVANEGKVVWNQLLKRVDVDALDNTQLRVFYTNLWKANLFPRYLHEVDGNGKEVHYSPYTGDVCDGKLVTDSGFWDAYRTMYSLQSVINPENLGMLIDGWVNTYKEAGWLPQWPSPNQRNSMIGTLGDVVLADAIAKKKLGRPNWI